jgi:aminomethyltransferase
MVLNGGNKWKDLEHFEEVRRREYGNADIKIEHLEDQSLVAVQGPYAAEALQKLFKTDLQRVSFMQFFKEKVEAGINAELTAYRTGYTGEDGFEVSMPSAAAVPFVEFLLSEGVTPAGLAARDALRLEAGLCLHGHDISEDISPVEAQLQWTIRKQNQKIPFIGYEALQKIKAVP